MPYICLAQTLPDGTVNILDLYPNTSLRNLVVDPQGQTKYANRVVNDALIIGGANGRLAFEAKGLGAYLVDQVEPGGSTIATGTIQVATSIATNNVSIAGVVFVAVNGVPNAAAQEYQDTAGAGSDIASAATLTATINDAASQTLISTATGGVVVTAADGGTDTVTLTASVAGPTGDLALATNSALTMVLSGPTMTRANSQWDAGTVATATAALIARVDAGLPLTLADVNTILSAVDAELTGVSTNSVGVLEDLLSVMAGRGYTVGATAQLYSPAGVFNPVLVGGFAVDVLTFDPEFNDSPSGTLVPTEVKPIRHTYDTGALQESAALGHILRFANGDVTLFPDSDMLPPIPGQQAPIVGARVITVYNDDGTVLV